MKVLNIISYQGTKNKTTMRYHFRPLEWLQPKQLITLKIGKAIRQLKLSYTAGRSMKWFNHFRELFVNVL